MASRRISTYRIGAIALAAMLAGCGSTEKPMWIGGPFAIRSAGYLTPDSHVPRALYYGKRQLATDIGDYSVSPDNEIILYDRKDLPSRASDDKPGLYVFNGHSGRNARVRDASPRIDPLSGARTADAVFFPNQYSLHWSADGAYVVVEDRYRGRWQIIDVSAARVLGPGWFGVNGASVFDAWKSNRAFTASASVQDGEADRRTTRDETWQITLDPLEVRRDNGSVVWPKQE
jgi:hypothetical protein